MVYHERSPVPVSNSSNPPATPRPAVVLVEDDADTREMYVSWLKHVGFTVFDAADADSGFVHALERQPRVVVTDYLLRSGATGAELCRRLKDDPRTAHIPTLLMTGLAERRTAERAIDLGCAIVRLKPYLPDAMIGDIEAIVRGDVLHQIPGEHTSSPAD